MTATLLLEVVDRDGVAVWRDLDRVEYQAVPPAAFGGWQAGALPIRVGHAGAPVGWLDYLEHDLGHGGGGLYGVGVVRGMEADEIDGLVQASAEIRCDALSTVERRSYRRDRSVRCYGRLDASRAFLDGVGLVHRTASVTATRVSAWPGDYRVSLDRGRMVRPPEIIERAAAAATYELRYRRPAALRIHRPSAAAAEERAGSQGEIYYSAPFAGAVLEVR